jgi:hypothetical protein
MTKLADSNHLHCESGTSCHCGSFGAYLWKAHEQEARRVEQRGGKDSTKGTGCGLVHHVIGIVQLCLLVQLCMPGQSVIVCIRAAC